MLFPIIVFSVICAVLVYLGFRGTSHKRQPNK